MINLYKKQKEEEIIKRKPNQLLASKWIGEKGILRVSGNKICSFISWFKKRQTAQVGRLVTLEEAEQSSGLRLYTQMEYVFIVKKL